MKRINFFKLLVASVLLPSCSESSVIGKNFVETNNVELVLNNSIDLDIATIKFDSLITSQANRMLIGGQESTDFGDIQIASYFLLSLADEETISSDDNLQYDSLTLTLPMDGYSLYLEEDIVFESVVVEQLIEELAYRDDDPNLYNFSELPGVTDLAGTVLAEQEFFWASDRIRDLEIRLPDELGRDLFDKFENSDEIFSVQGEANEYLKGFKVSLKNPDFAIGFAKDSVRLTIHTTDNSTSPRSNIEFDFYIDLTPYFVKYTQTNIPEELDIRELDEEVPSSELANYSYISAGIGYATTVDLTSLRDLLLDGDDFILADVELWIRWFESSHETYPERLTARLVDEDFADLIGEPFFLERIIDEEYGRDNYYVVTITSIADFILDQPVGQEYYLLLTTDEYNSSLTSIKLGDRTFSSELNIYTFKN